jgi:hypothetical protein
VNTTDAKTGHKQSRRKCRKKCCECRFLLSAPRRARMDPHIGGARECRLFQGHKGRHRCRRQIEMMDAILKPDVQEVIIQKSTQIQKAETSQNLVLDSFRVLADDSESMTISSVCRYQSDRRTDSFRDVYRQLALNPWFSRRLVNRPPKRASRTPVWARELTLREG